MPRRVMPEPSPRFLAKTTTRRLKAAASHAVSDVRTALPMPSRGVEHGRRHAGRHRAGPGAGGGWPMSGYRRFDADDAMRAAQAALSLAAGHAVTVGQAQALGDAMRRNLVLRASAVSPDGAARPIIVKASRAPGYDAAAPDAFEAPGLLKEWAAVALLGRDPRRAGIGPALLAADMEQGVLVLEDLGEGLASLVRPLLEGAAAEAEAALTAHARALARLHAATLGCEDEHAALVREALPNSRIPLRASGWVDRVAHKATALLGGALPEAEVALIAEHLQKPGPWLALVHRDGCPDNVLLPAPGEARLIDFEFAAPGHALLDAAYWRMGFPTCWCAGVVPDPVAARLDTAYRAILAEAVPAAADDAAFRTESAIIGSAWLFNSLAWLLEPALREDGRWGIASRRSRILHYLEAARRMTAEAGMFPGLRDLIGGWLDQLRPRWAPAAPLPPYAAFAGPAS